MKNINKENINIAHRKENKLDSGYKILYLDGEKLETLIDCRFYFAGNTYYCCIWIYDRKNNNFLSSSGKAGGYGYCKKSGAFSDAVSKIKLELMPTHSAGSDAVEKCLHKIAEHFGYKKNYIVDFYG